MKLECKLPDAEIWMRGSEEALSEVISNLVVNAVEAQPSGGLVRVSLARRDCSLELDIVDHGSGIPAELREKIFQPFFTTKTKGTGLGLAIVARRLEELGGTIVCESPIQDGRGTRFRVTLPLE